MEQQNKQKTIGAAVIIAVVVIVYLLTTRYISFLKENGLLTLAFGTGCAVLIISALKKEEPKNV